MHRYKERGEKKEWHSESADLRQGQMTHFALANPSTRFYENWAGGFCVILLTNRQTDRQIDKQTNRTENTTSFDGDEK